MALARLALADVADDRRDADQRAGIVVHRRHADGDVEQVAVLVPAQHVHVHGGAGAHLGVEVVEARRWSSGGDRMRTELADGLLGACSRTARGGRVPGADDAIGRQADDGAGRGGDDGRQMRLRAACGPRARVAASASTRESSSTSRSVEEMGVDRPRLPERGAGARKLGDRRRHQPADADRRQQRERQQRRARPQEPGPGLPQRRLDHATAAPRRRPASRVSLEVWKACSERLALESPVVMTPSRRSPYWRSMSAGTGLPRNSFASCERAMMRFLRSADRGDPALPASPRRSGSPPAAPARAT